MTFVRARWRVAVLLLLVAVLPRDAGAIAPDRRFRTLESPHFLVHFHEGLYALALRASQGLEEAHQRLVPLLDTEPRRKTEIVLIDDQDAANGSATVVDRPRITVLAEPPDSLSVLGDYDDYLSLLLVHEYVHVLHLGHTRGVPAWLDAIFGPVFLPNAYQPRFLTEGLATYEESQLTSAGRIRSALFDMYLRAELLEGGPLSLGSLANDPGRWPRGAAAYLYGGHFFAYVAATRGDEVLRDYLYAYGDDLIPFGLNLAFAEAAGADLRTLWAAWIEHLNARYEAQLQRLREEGPVTRPTRVTTFGDQTGSPRFDARGELFYLEVSGDRRPNLRRLDPRSGEDVALAELDAAGTFAPLPSGGVILARPEVRRTYRTNGELFFVDEQGERQLTSGLRASELDVSPDGQTVYFVRRDRGETHLAAIARAAPRGPPTILYTPPSGRQLFTPSVSPDGARLVFTQSRGDGGRDLFLLRLADGSVQRLTDERSYKLDPAFTPDGARVLFASDRSGIFDLYAMPAEGGELTRLTHVETGAFSPRLSPDGRLLAFTTYGRRGFDVALIEVDRLQPHPAATFVDDRPPPLPHTNPQLHPVRAYRPLDTFGAHLWLPFAAADPDGLVLGATTSASDTLGFHQLALSAGVGMDSGEPNGTLRYAYGGLYPTLEGTVASHYRGISGAPADRRERASSARAALTFPFDRLRSSHRIGVGYEVTLLVPGHVGKQGAQRGVATELQGSYRFSAIERPPDAISPESGFSFSLGGRVAAPELGGTFRYGTAEAAGALFLRVPWASHHVLATEARLGIGAGLAGRRPLFTLGGLQLRDPVLDVLYTARSIGPVVLRGYAPGAFSGNRLVLGTTEYRFPLARVNDAPAVAPMFLGDVSGALFAEAGTADEPTQPLQLHPSLGAELRLELLLGWGLATTLRVGGAYGLDRRARGGEQLYAGVTATY